MPLSQKQIEIIGECLRAAAYGPFFPDGEFDTIFGLSREQVAAVADQWPVVLDAREWADLAIHNSFNHLTGYPIKKERMEHWEDYLSVERGEVRELFDEWLAWRDRERSKNRKQGARGYFEDIF